MRPRDIERAVRKAAERAAEQKKKDDEENGGGGKGSAVGDMEVAK
jgi:hypothetical protein